MCDFQLSFKIPKNTHLSSPSLESIFLLRSVPLYPHNARLEHDTVHRIKNILTMAHQPLPHTISIIYVVGNKVGVDSWKQFHGEQIDISFYFILVMINNSHNHVIVRHDLFLNCQHESKSTKTQRKHIFLRKYR